MTFLNAALLAGLLALAIPILIHLFHKSQFEVVKWGAMHLLEAVIRTNQRRIRIEQLILLAIRCAIPILLALAMARPIWKGAQALLGETKTSTVLLLDNSYSMAAGRAGLSNFSIARDEATRLLADLQRGSEAQVVLLGEGGASLLSEPTYDLARLTQALGKLEPRAGPAQVPAALSYSTNVFAQMHEPARQLILLTDFQRISFEATEDKLLGETIARLKALPIPPQITLFDIGSEAKDNVAVESLEFSRLMIGVGQKIQVRANVRNFGDTPYPELRVYFKADGKEKAASQLRLGAREKGQVLFTHSFETAGSHIIEVVADADPLLADNNYLASIPVRDRVPVLLVDGDPSSEPMKGETDYAAIALQPFAASGKVELSDLLTTRVIKAEELNAKALTGQAVVLLANVRKLSEQQLTQLEDFVRTGGGLLIFPGDRSDPAWYNSAFFRDGKGALPQPLGSIGGTLKEGTPAVAIAAQRYENPALELFNDPRNGSLADSAIKLWFKRSSSTDTPAQDMEGVDAADVTTLARLENGDSFLTEKAFGEGRVIQCATALDADWSNLPMRPFYLPLLQRLCVYLGSTVYPPHNLAVGAPITAFLPADAAEKKATVVAPDGLSYELPIEKKGERGVVEFARTQQPGVYTLKAPGGTSSQYVVQASRRESDLQKLSAQEINDLAKQHGVSLVRSGAEYKALESTRRFGTEFWKPLLWLLLGLAFLELILQQRFARAKGSGAPR